MDLLDPPIVDLVASTYEQRARERIRGWLHVTNMTQTQLGERIGRNQEWMSRYLSGQFNADFQTLERMAQAFGHSLTALLDLPQDPLEARLLDVFRALPPKSRDTLLEFLSTFHPSGRVSPKSRL